jgi:hypothetical protein
MPQKMLVGDKDTVLLIPAFELNGIPQAALPTGGVAVPISAPTTALLNYYIPITTPAPVGARWGGNITCSIIDDWTLALTDSSTMDIRTLCSVGQSQELTFYNYDASMNFLRDINPADTTSEFNLPAPLVGAPDVAYIIAHRVGYSRTVAAAIGQEWHLYYVWTDHTIPAAADGDYMALGQAFVPKGVINFKYVLTA